MPTSASAPVPVVVVHYQAPDWLEETVRSLLASNVPVDVTVVNNGGSLPDLPAVVGVIVPDENRGYAGAANIGLRRWLAGTSPYCVVTSHDVTVQPDTLNRLIEAAEANPAFGTLGPNVPQREVSETAGVVERDVIIGTCMVLRRSCVEEVGVFDEAFGSYYEDYDLCWRLRAAGWRVGVVARAPVASHGTAHPRTARPLMLANQVLFAGKHRGRWAATKRLVAMLGLVARDFARALTDANEREQHLRHASARLRAAPRATRHLARILVGSTREDTVAGVRTSQSRRLRRLEISSSARSSDHGHQ